MYDTGLNPPSVNATTHVGPLRFLQTKFGRIKGALQYSEPLFDFEIFEIYCKMMKFNFNFATLQYISTIIMMIITKVWAPT